MKGTTIVTNLMDMEKVMKFWRNQKNCKEVIGRFTEGIDGEKVLAIDYYLEEED